MNDADLLGMLASETDRRAGNISKGVGKLAGSSNPDPKGVESLRIEVHGLKGAAMVVGQKKLGKLAERMEELLAERTGSGLIEADLGDRLMRGVAAFKQGADAAAAGQPEPPSVDGSLSELS